MNTVPSHLFSVSETVSSLSAGTSSDSSSPSEVVLAVTAAGLRALSESTSVFNMANSVW